MKKSEKLTSYEEVCKAEGVDPILSLPFQNPETDEQRALNGLAQSFRIVRVFNKFVKPNYDNSDVKYSAWWNMRSKAAGGPGFSFNGYDYGTSHSTLGARLDFLDYDSMKWVTSQPEFVEIFKSWMTIPE